MYVCICIRIFSSSYMLCYAQTRLLTLSAVLMGTPSLMPSGSISAGLALQSMSHCPPIFFAIESRDSPVEFQVLFYIMNYISIINYITIRINVRGELSSCTMYYSRCVHAYTRVRVRVRVRVCARARVCVCVCNHSCLLMSLLYTCMYKIHMHFCLYIHT
jgi:hypothetical protein